MYIQREKITAEAQDLRVEKWEKYLNDNQEASKQEKEKQLNALKDAEFKHIQKQYWGDYAAKESPAWEAYKEKHVKSALNEMAQNFFKPIFQAEDKSSWKGIKLMTVDAKFMESVAGFDDPQAVLDKLVAESYKETTFKDLEEKILFNLYKKHQKHAFDYYNYSNGNDK